ncbi:metal ABC transporter ATP-binding protein [Neptuniibacter sp.]|uniref:metal ABC transporter ATP-binding protein n=1 Tax=Neptuniibacter sp. TaxID=1962643 RepID=UPI00263735FC|nr:metal ABC transporter ATP-binding protein [Neptuniibacter sp.]MCP4595297.1 metal ABC transporter ATP-binding protein [Neptuniibacter sp.]
MKSKAIGPSVTLDKVSLSIDGNRILKPISAHLESGQMHLLIGPNGAGKTSLLKSMLGLTPHRGEIFRHWPDKKMLPAYIPQQPRFDQVLPVTVADFLCAGLTNKPIFFGRKKWVEDRVTELLGQVGLQGKERLSLGKLSGGERQRLMFAQALSRKTDLWFLDEPMTGLDADGQQLITELMISLRNAGKTLIVVHHDMSFVEQYADNVLLINGGLISDGSANEVDLSFFNTSHKPVPVEAVA